MLGAKKVVPNCTLVFCYHSYSSPGHNIYKGTLCSGNICSCEHFPFCIVLRDGLPGEFTIVHRVLHILLVLLLV